MAEFVGDEVDEGPVGDLVGVFRVEVVEDEGDFGVGDLDCGEQGVHEI